MIDIRHRLNDYLLQFGGHIGYSVRRSERCKGYATEMLRQALQVVRDLGLEKVLVTCDKDNILSSKVIIKNGGVLENEVNNTNGIVSRYWIKVLYKRVKKARIIRFFGYNRCVENIR